jgi:DNA-binding response OmpR family regulator
MKTAKKIFIADDDDDILSILALMLKTKGYEVQACTNANKVFDQRDKPPDLILLDIWMSGIDGRDICNRLKNDAALKHVPVIFVSANARLEEIALECKASDYISKPFEMDYLLDKIQANLILEQE